MRKRSNRSRGVSWIGTFALATASFGVADLALMAQDGSGSSLEANPFFSPSAPTPAPQAKFSPRAEIVPQTSLPAATAPAMGNAAQPRYAMRRLPSPPAIVRETNALPIAVASRRLPPPLPTANAEVASLAPTMPLESPTPAKRFDLGSLPPVKGVPQKGTNLAAIAAKQTSVAKTERTQLGSLEEYKLDVADAQLGVVAEQTRTLVVEGIGLAERGAFFSARSNFEKALRTVAQALDGESRRPVHADALDAGLKALDEADDFAGDSSAAGADVATIAGRHRTPALTKEQAAAATPNEAMRAYYSFAAEALSRCAGSSEAAAEALFQLGKLQTFVADQQDLGSTAAIPRSTALYHAALAVSPRHARAGNELGFLLAKSGDYAHARAMLQRAVASEPLAEAWHNLAVVHERLGETDLATEARDRFAAIAAAQGGTSIALGSTATPRVTWVAPETMKTPPAETFRSPDDEKTGSPSTAPARTASGMPADAATFR